MCVVIARRCRVDTENTTQFHKVYRYVCHTLMMLMTKRRSINNAAADDDEREIKRASLTQALDAILNSLSRSLK